MIHYLYLGRVDYDEALRLQEELVALRQQGRIENTLLLLEHPSVLTLGRNADRSNILASDALLASRGVTLHEINRGGDVTYHGPGQLIGYPIFDLRSLRNPSGSRMGPVDFVRHMEEALIRLCGAFGVPAGRICGLTGVWCHRRWGRAARGGPLDEICGELSKDRPSINRPDGERKIAAIGIHVSRGVTSHGFAFNVTTDLRDFQLINPCGITDRPVTSLKRELERQTQGAAERGAARPRNLRGPDLPSFDLLDLDLPSLDLPSLDSIAHEAARQFGSVFGEQVTAIASLADLRAKAAAKPETEPSLAPGREKSAPEFPAEDTPLTIPRDVQRLRGRANRPVNA